jgi:hypothetical protein
LHIFIGTSPNDRIESGIDPHIFHKDVKASYREIIVFSTRYAGTYAKTRALIHMLYHIQTIFKSYIYIKSKPIKPSEVNILENICDIGLDNETHKSTTHTRINQQIRPHQMYNIF